VKSPNARFPPFVIKLSSSITYKFHEESDMKTSVTITWSWSRGGANDTMGSV